ncbi:hypothetical protein ThrDRAFT_03335 [Frankia casuarinae]|uniref:hypothetical protein n=1 Tax=Frankia TaxID=1854 RepID=UPI0003D00F76|nr:MULTISPECIES: hypothetical protein [Frankia]ETA03198.1 hypothetical protein CcI6DRAFT_01353 [Frankia sp. CcI6]KFB03786.1 hypothetical protein ALLO2DRAFT_03457 [Frankia sp. Allo2]EYT91001.1 hypothetical protein ThrDRAFT_03335 [Frankia casuarinae]KEZ37010.1 hypothetical protein CEDDRAFT_01537 [Frankia sp. CeD]OAA21286.1 hypothetical protein AAY23_108037 [Frankia casuarinae]
MGRRDRPLTRSSRLHNLAPWKVLPDGRSPDSVTTGRPHPSDAQARREALHVLSLHVLSLHGLSLHGL